MASVRQIHNRELMLVLPILPGKSEAWRRFMQEMKGSRHPDYEASRRRLGISAERTWISYTPQGDQAIMVIEADNPEQALLGLTTSEAPFDDWFRRQIVTLHGVDLRQAGQKLVSDLVLEWQAS